MKFEGFDWGLLSLFFIVIFDVGNITYSGQQQRVTFQQTYNKNLECRQALKGEIMKIVNEICGPVPQIKDFVGGN